MKRRKLLSAMGGISLYALAGCSHTADWSNFRVLSVEPGPPTEKAEATCGERPTDAVKLTPTEDPDRRFGIRGVTTATDGCHTAEVFFTEINGDVFEVDIWTDEQGAEVTARGDQEGYEECYPGTVQITYAATFDFVKEDFIDNPPDSVVVRHDSRGVKKEVTRHQCDSDWL